MLSMLVLHLSLMYPCTTLIFLNYCLVMVAVGTSLPVQRVWRALHQLQDEEDEEDKEHDNPQLSHVSSQQAIEQPGKSRKRASNKMS